MTPGIFELAFIVTLAAVLGFVARAFGQPTLLGYLLTGAILGIFESFQLSDFTTFHVFSDLGIMFLLFLVGLEINYTSLRLIGRAALVVGLGQIFFTFLLAFGLANFLSFGVLPAAYLGLALTFSSTIIIVKLLSDKKDLGSLWGKMSLGILLVQDMIAILLLVILSGTKLGNDPSVVAVVWTLVKAGALFALIIFLGRTVFPPLFDRAARSHELLFITSLAWMFLLAAAVSKIGFSVEIAGFLAGLALANSSEHFQIAARVRPLRDFFLVIFFALLGSSLLLGGAAGTLQPIVIFSLFVLIVNPLIVLVLMGLLGFRKRASFLTAISITQISEFSLILVALGAKLGHVGREEVAIVTGVGVLTIAISSYLVLHSDWLFRVLSSALAFFERATARDRKFPVESFHKPIIVIGYHRTGQSIVKALPKQDVLVIDFDPQTVAALKENGYDHLFGDMGDEEIFDRANLATARLIVSTSPDLEDNLALLTLFRKRARKPKIVVRAETEKDAQLLYEHGAYYVLVPHVSSGHYLGKLIAEDPSLVALKKLREKSLVQF